MRVWLAEQLTSQYQVPHQWAAKWVAESRILPLLDNLDEVAAERRRACVEKLNTSHGLPLVVCCREQEYAALPRLQLLGAVIVQPLSDEQIETYLSTGGARLEGVRALLADDPALIAEEAESGRLIATPLMLSMLTLAYADVPIIHLQGITPIQRRAEVFDRYIDQVFVYRTPNPRFTKAMTISRLRWLAWQLQRTQRNIFLIEEMQPDWADTVWLHHLVGGQIRSVVRRTWSWQSIQTELRSSIVFGLVFGLSGGLVVALRNGLALGLLIGLVFGLVFGLVWLNNALEIAEETHVRIQPNSSVVASFRNGLVSALFGVLVFGLVFGLDGGPGLGLGGGLVFGLIFGLNHGLSAVLGHYLLRAFLVMRHLIPWNITAFCDDCASRALLRRVGGGWIFVHRLLLEHLAHQYSSRR